MSQDIIEVLSFENKQVLNTEVIARLVDANKAHKTKDGFIFDASEGFAEFVESLNADEFTKEVWEGAMDYIKTEIVNTFKISPNTAKDYLTEIVEILKLRNPAIIKPASKKADAIRKAEKKIQADAKLAEYEHIAVESLAPELVSLATKTDKESVARFKEISSVIKSKNDAQVKEIEKQEKDDRKAFKESYTKDFKDIFTNEYEFAQYLHANITKYRADFAKSK